MNTFTNEDYKNLLVFLNRADLKGNESIIHAVLVQKVASQITEAPKKEESNKKDDKKDDTTK